MAAHGVKFQNFPLRQPVFRSPKAEGMFGTVSLNSRSPATDLDLIHQSADVDGDSQISTDQFLHYFLERVEVGKDSGGSCPILLIRNQSGDMDIVLKHVSLLAVTHINRLIFQADPHKFLKFGSGSLTRDSLGRVSEDDIVLFQALPVSLPMQCIRHTLIFLKRDFQKSPEISDYTDYETMTQIKSTMEIKENRRNHFSKSV